MQLVALIRIVTLLSANVALALSCVVFVFCVVMDLRRIRVVVQTELHSQLNTKRNEKCRIWDN